MIEKNPCEEEIKRETRKSVLVHIVNTENQFKASHYFSSYDKLIRFLAWMHRLFTNCRKKIENRKALKGDNHEIPTYLSETERKNLRLTHAERKTAEINLFKQLQVRMFGSISKTRLSAFKTMKDENGLYVLKTKIFNRTDNYSFLCPILLYDDNDIIPMLIQEYHEIMGHAGTQIITAKIRERFWVISLRKVTRSVINNCVTCKRQK
ncbi:PREDICTED: uncharacterized protein LOC105462090, partial [Wasmannia auropunctata]|uniref:uncharacterized protein LOC105462090 n=1 Tax=Wasmannia auropunctata TaxID=64793 RepID=UPI0005EDF553